MGLFFYIHSVALIEDLPLEEEYHSVEEFYAAANAAYNQVRKYLTTKSRHLVTISLFYTFRMLTIVGLLPVFMF